MTPFEIVGTLVIMLLGALLGAYWGRSHDIGARRALEAICEAETLAEAKQIARRFLERTRL